MLGPWLAVSTSTDQRATMFRIAFDTQGGLRMRKLASVVTSVADVADLAVLRPTGRPPLMAISGIGLELLQLPASQGS